MATLQNHDVAANVAHSASAQHQEALNHSPPADSAHQHNHGHLHHDAHAEQGRDEEVTYFQDTTVEKGIIPHQDPQSNDLHRRLHSNNHQSSAEILDTEKGAMSSIPLEEEDPQSHKAAGFYTKYRIFFHVFIWLFFTG